MASSFVMVDPPPAVQDAGTAPAQSAKSPFSSRLLAVADSHAAVLAALDWLADVHCKAIASRYNSVPVALG